MVGCAEVECPVVIHVRGLLGGLDRIPVTQLLGPLPLGFHVSAPHQLHTQKKPFRLSLFIQIHQLVVSIPSVKLKRSINNRPLLIEVAHHFQGQVINHSLISIVLGVNKYPYIEPVRLAAELFHPPVNVVKSLLVLAIQLYAILALGHQFFRAQGRHFHHRKRDVRSGAGIHHGLYNFPFVCLKSGLAFLPFGRVIEYGAYAGSTKVRNRLLTLLNRLTPAKMPKNCTFYEFFDGQFQF